MSLFYLSLVYILESLKTQSLLENVRGICRKCGKTISFWGGIFCGNFCNQRGHWKAYLGIWCGRYYHSAEIDNHRIVKPQEEDGFELELDKDKGRHLFARDGDHLMISFQCELCQFRNLKGCDPGIRDEDFLLLRTIRRANLDAFWSREPGTVEATRRDSRKLIKVGAQLGLDYILPMMGTFPVGYPQDMGISICMLQRSLDKGRYQPTLQFETIRKMRSAYSNVWHASRHALTTSVMARDVRKTYVTSCPSYSLWFERFIVGMHKRMGDEVHQDKAVTLEVVHKLIEGLEVEYARASGDQLKESIGDMGVFILASFLAGLRGEETLKLVLGETRDYLDESKIIEDTNM